MKQKLLITGASGFIGSSLYDLAQNEWAVIGTAFKNKGDKLLVAHDLTNHLSTEQLLLHFQPDAIVHLAANGNANECETKPEITKILNVDASTQLASYAHKHQIPFVFSSTDLVFDGKKGNYSELDTPNPINKYGEQKLMAEKNIQKVYPKAVICRLPLVVGRNGGYAKSFINQLRNNKEQHLFVDEFRSPAAVNDICIHLLKALHWPEGIYHLGGPQKMNRYELGMWLAEQHQLTISLIKKSQQSAFKFTASRPADVTMVNNKAKLKPLIDAY